MLVSHGADTKKVRNINRMVVVNMIREHGGLSKAGIARMSGISISTVNRVIDELLEEGLIQPARNRLERGGGRPGEIFEYNGKLHYAIGIDLGFPNLRGMIADLSGIIHKEVAIPAEPGNGNENYSRLLLLVRQLQDELGDSLPVISGAGLGVAGNVDRDSGMVLQSGIMGWSNFPLGRRLQQDTGLTLSLDSDINLITLGEHGFGVGQGAEQLVCMTLGTRVLCGLILNGEIYRGANFNSGRLDHFIYPTANGAARLEEIVSAPSVFEAGKKNLARSDPQRARTLVDAKDVYQAARDGETWAMETLQGIVPALGMAIANIASLMDPEMIVFSGRWAEDAALLAPLVTGYLSDKVEHVPVIQASSLGTRATVLGAIMLVYKGILHNW